MREALEGRAEAQRTRRDYDRVLDGFRAVYHGNPREPHADASVAAVAELLAEQGRLFEDRKASLDAIGEYEFLRRAYPGSRHRESALLTEGEIYGRDLGDRANARGIFASFLRLYPRSALAAEARLELGRLQPAVAAVGTSGTGRTGGAGRIGPAGHHRAVLDAAIASRQGAQQTSQQGGGAPVPGATRRAARSAAPGAASGAAPGAASRPEFGATPGPTSGPAPGAASGPALGAASGGTARIAAGAGGRAGRDTLVERDLPSQQAAAAPERGGAGRQPGAPAWDASSTPAMGGREPVRDTTLTDAALSAPPPPRRGRLPLVTGVRHWSTAVYTRVAIDLQDEVQYEASRAPNPDRIFFDLHGAKLSPELIGKAVTVTDGGYLKRIRAAQFSGDVVRVVLDVSDVSEYSAFFLPNPSRLIVDIHGNAPGGGEMRAGGGQAGGAAAKSGTDAAVGGRGSASSQAVVGGGATGGSNLRTAPVRGGNAAAALSDVATLDRQPDTVRATRHPTTAPVAAVVANQVANTSLAPQAEPGGRAGSGSGSLRRGRVGGRAGQGTPADSGSLAIHALEAGGGSVRAAAPTAAGERSMVRALGLKIGRIVIDAGHGGHDSGTLGPGGIEEKDVVLDVALRLGRLLKQRLGADVIYTRDDDTFIPLETRTAIANRAQADLFLSVHANSSQDASARGVETYYLNFTSSADALEVAARENAVSDQSIHQLSDLVKKITLQDKIAESREFAGDVEQSLYAGLENGNSGLKDRGVKKAPFVVLIGANMPSILAEISFLTNPEDARQLRDGEYRQRIAESIYRGVARYVGSLSGVRLAQDGMRPTGE